MTDLERAARALATADGVSDTFFDQPGASVCWDEYLKHATAVIESALLEPSEAAVGAVARAAFGSQYWDEDGRESNAERGRYGPPASERMRLSRAALRAAALAILGREGSADG